MKKTSIFMMLTGAIFLLSGCPKKGEPTNTKDNKDVKKVDFMAEDQKVDNRLEIPVFAKDDKLAALKLHMAPAKSSGLNVSLIPEGAVKPGTDATAAVHTALLNASLLVGKEMDKFEVKVTGSWGIDATASQAAFAAVMMAAMTSSKINKEVAVAGSINPDGTIGPVDGLPAKLQAAAAAGKKSFGYPAGQKLAYDEATKNFVDLDDIAKKAGVKLIALDTVYSAFRALTGAEVKLPALIKVDEMKLDKELSDQLAGMASNWHKKHNEYAKKYKKVYVAPKAKTKKWKKIADEYKKSSTDLIKKGEVSPGYDYAQRGGSFAFTSYWAKRFDRLDKRKNLKGMLKALGEFVSVRKEMGAAMKSFKEMKPESRGDLLALVSAWEQLVSAWAYGKQGDAVAKETLDKINYLISKKLAPSMDQGRLYTMLDNTTLKYSMASLKAQKAVDFSKFVGVKGAKFIVQLDKFKRIAAIMKAVANASMAHTDTLFLLNDVAKTGAAKESIKSVLMNTNNNYLQAVTILGFPEAEAKEESFENLLAGIAAYTASYFNNAMLTLKYVSLQVTKDAQGNVEIKRKKALEAMLAAAEQNVLQQAALSKKYAGVIPASAKFFFNIGLSMKDQNYSLKMKALEMFWKASMECQLSILMAQ